MLAGLGGERPVGLVRPVGDVGVGMGRDGAENVKRGAGLVGHWRALPLHGFHAGQLADRAGRIGVATLPRVAAAVGGGFVACWCSGMFMVAGMAGMVGGCGSVAFLFRLAIAGHCSPRELQRQQQGQEKNQCTHEGDVGLATGPGQAGSHDVSLSP